MPGIFNAINDAFFTSFVLLWFGQSVRTSGIWLLHKMLNKHRVVIVYMRNYRALLLKIHLHSVCTFE